MTSNYFCFKKIQIYFLEFQIMVACVHAHPHARTSTHTHIHAQGTGLTSELISPLTPSGGPQVKMPPASMEGHVVFSAPVGAEYGLKYPQ